MLKLLLPSLVGDASHLAAISTVDNLYANILAEFPNIVVPTFSQTTTKHNVEHFVPTMGPPIQLSNACRLPPDELALAKEEFHKNGRNGHTLTFQ